MTFAVRQRKFTAFLLQWHKNQNKRVLPWKGIRDPYLIWLSEIILQQTRAEQGIAYYLRFQNRYPNVFELADASDQEVFRLWQGLGYYNRCRNLLFTAREIVHRYQGTFPENFQELKSLKGIGDYTASAIASFAFQLPHAVVDGNVIRVLSRVFLIEEDAQSSGGKKRFSQLAHELLPHNEPAAFNQAIMDLGATLCKPQKPLCYECPLQTICIAHNQKLTAIYPRKKVKPVLKQRFLHFFVPHPQQRILIIQRPSGDIWANLWTPFFQETATDKAYQAFKGTWTPVEILTQNLTHQKIIARFYQVPDESFLLSFPSMGTWVQCSQLDSFAFPRVILSFFKKYHYL